MGTFNAKKPALLWVDSDTFLVAQCIRYWADNGDLIEIPILHRNGQRIGMLSDLGSKPLWTAAFVGDRADEGVLAYLGHDFLFTCKFVLRNGVPIEVDFKRTQELLFEMLMACGMTKKKADIIVDAVGLTGESRYNKRTAVDLSKVDVNNLGKDFAVLFVKVTPDFDVIEDKENKKNE